MKSLLKIPYYLLIVAVATVGLLLLATMVPIPGNVKVKIVKSGSMEPTIMTGGIVVIRPETNYGMGDIITFGPDTKTQIPTTHRIVQVDGEGVNKTFHTKGDANDAQDPSQTKLSAVDGKVIFSLSYIGYILDFARKPLGFFLLVGIPALIVIIDEVSKIWKEIRRMRGGGKGTLGRNKKSIVVEFKDENPRKNVLDLRMNRPQKMSFSLKSVVLLLIILSGSMIGLSRVGSTVSYYNERETSGSNTLQASSDFGTSTPVESQIQKLDVNTDDQVVIQDDATSTDATSTPEVIEEATSTPEITPPDPLLQQEGEVTPSPEVVTPPTE